jgi:hypothetical protein
LRESEMGASGEVRIAIDDSFVGTVCDFGAGVLKLKYIRRETRR